MRDRIIGAMVVIGVLMGIATSVIQRPTLEVGGGPPPEVTTVLNPPNADYVRGFCEGYRWAQRGVMANRDHYRSLLKLPDEAHDAVIKRIRSGKPLTGNVADKLEQALVDGIDMFVVLPEVKCEEMFPPQQPKK